MSTLEMMLQFCRSGTSLAEARDLMITCGYDRVEVQDAITEIVMSDDVSFRYVNAPWPVNCKIFIE